jgi:hypothetical protein
MFDFLFFQEDVPSKGYYAGDLKPIYAISALIIVFLAGGYLEGLDQAGGF